MNMSEDTRRQPSNTLTMGRLTADIFVWISACIALLAASAALCAPPDSANCLMCHSAGSIAGIRDGKPISLHVDTSHLRGSVHRELGCVECHADLQDRPQMHAAEVAPVQCARCHEHKISNPDEVHASIGRGKTPPKCQDCHGAHGVKPVKDPRSKVSRDNSIGTCAKCHARVKSMRAYQASVHGTIKNKGAMPAAVCADCHRVHQPPQLGRAVDCIRCHDKQGAQYMAGSHGTARAGGDLNAPDCVDCHGGHGVLTRSDPHASMSAINEPRKCGECHDDKKLMESYRLPANSLKTYRHSYHGKANLHGSLESATCSDCHGAHKILPSSDSASATNGRNIDKTCAACHPGVNRNVAKGAVHVEITREQSALLYYVANGFKWLTIGTMVMLCGHIMLDLFSRVRRRLFVWPRSGK